LRVGGLGNGGVVTAPPNSLRANWWETLPHKGSRSRSSQ
jgi:hypothetical protein